MNKIVGYLEIDAYYSHNETNEYHTLASAKYPAIDTGGSVVVSGTPDGDPFSEMVLDLLILDEDRVEGDAAESLPFDKWVGRVL